MKSKNPINKALYATMDNPQATLLIKRVPRDCTLEFFTTVKSVIQSVLTGNCKLTFKSPAHYSSFIRSTGDWKLQADLSDLVIEA